MAVARAGIDLDEEDCEIREVFAVLEKHCRFGRNDKLEYAPVYVLLHRHSRRTLLEGRPEMDAWMAPGPIIVPEHVLWTIHALTQACSTCSLQRAPARK